MKKSDEAFLAPNKKRSAAIPVVNLFYKKKDETFINKQNYKNPKSHCGYGDSFAVKQFKIISKFALANLINKSDEGYLRKKNSP